MVKIITVTAHTRKAPEKPEDPFATTMSARRRSFARKWGVELVGSNDDRLSAPVPKPGPSGISIAEIKSQLAGIAKLMSKILRLAKGRDWSGL